MDAVNNNHSSTGNVHISNYKKALLAMFDKKKVWHYLNDERAKYQKNKKMEKFRDCKINCVNPPLTV